MIFNEGIDTCGILVPNDIDETQDDYVEINVELIFWKSKIHL